MFSGDTVTGYGAVDSGFMHISYLYLTLALHRSVIGTHCTWCYSLTSVCQNKEILFGTLQHFLETDWMEIMNAIDLMD